MRFPAIATLALLAAMPQSPPAVRDQLRDLETRVQTAIKAGDHQSRIAADMELLRLLNGSPSAIEALARAYAAAGNPTQAIAALNQFADLGLADDTLLNGSDKAFSALAPQPEYKQVLERFRQKPETCITGNHSHNASGSRPAR
jgi:DNA-binding SARP family transcriptional activator